MGLSSRKKQMLKTMGIPVWNSHRHLPGERIPELINNETFSTNETAEFLQVATPSSVAPVRDLSDWKRIQQEVQICTACSLHETRSNTVFGVGDNTTDLMIIGEAPGQDEDKQGEPFVGPAGLLLTQMLLSIGFSRERVFIANILKCRPPNNRDPRVDEVSKCADFLRRQIEWIQPKIILSIGRVSAQSLLKKDDAVGKLRGRVHQHPELNIPIVVTYHPAYLLRSPQEKTKSWQDLLMVKKLLQEKP